MIKMLIPVLLALFGVAGGVGAGLALRPDPAEVAATNPCGDAEPEDNTKKGDGDGTVAGHTASEPEYVKLNNQFVVPVVGNELVDSLVVMSLSVEITAGQSQEVYKREPKLRDAFLQVLFDHANMGGFGGEFTNSSNMDVLRAALTETAQSVVGKLVTGVLITDIARQDI